MVYDVVHELCIRSAAELSTCPATTPVLRSKPDSCLDCLIEARNSAVDISKSLNDTKVRESLRQPVFASFNQVVGALS